jgi:membrane associated rhomboid family serine protease
MSYQQMERKGKIRFGEDGNALLSLIFVIVTAFLILIFIKIVYQLSNTQASYEELYQSQIINYTALPAQLTTFITRPWVIITHMISHFDVWGMIGNMFFLWAFGFLLQDLTGNKHIIPLFIYGGLAGAILFVASANLLPKFAAEIQLFQYTGASAGIMAIAIAATVTAPDYRLFPMINGGIPLWVITLIYVIVDFAGLASKAFPHHLAHLSGAFTGFLYIKQVQNGNNPGSWMHRFYFWFVHLFDPKQKPEQPSVKQQVFYNTKGKQPFTKSPSITQQRVDAILDKINQQGYHALTQEEKDILKKAGEDETL